MLPALSKNEHSFHSPSLFGCQGTNSSPESAGPLEVTHEPLTRAGLFLLQVERVPSCPFPPSPNESIFPEEGVKAKVCCLLITKLKNCKSCYIVSIILNYLF